MFRHAFRFIAPAALAVAMLSAPPVAAETVSEAASVFGARQSVTDVAISPNGKRIAYISPGASSDETIYVVELDAGGEHTPIAALNEPNARLTGCQWATDERIVCQVYGINNVGGILLYFTRVIGMNADGSGMKRLSADTNSRSRGIIQDGGSLVALEVEGEDDRILMTRRYLKEDGANTRLFNDREGLGVDLIDPSNGRAKTVEQPNDKALHYIADENGRVRVMLVGDRSVAGYDGSEYRYLYRPLGSDRWDQLSAVDAGGAIAKGFQPVAVDSERNVAYGFDQHNGYQALFSVALDGSGRRELVKARDDVDVDQLVRIGRNGRVIGVSYATEQRLVEYFDPELDRFASALAQSLPDTPLISILDANEGENRLLVAASSDTEPGKVYLYEKDARALGELFALRDPLKGRNMGSMEPVSFAASDGTAIPGYLTLPAGTTRSEARGLPAVVMPHGGPGSRDEWGFDWLAQFFAARGYAVLQPNFRGSAGYGEAWFGRNGFQEWKTAIGDVNDAGRWLVSQGIADPGKLGVIGWSYGGYAALQSQVLDPQLYKAVVAIAPVADLDLLREENREYTSYAAVDRFVGRGDHVASGSPARHASRFAAPVLLVHGTFDLNVSDAHSKLMRDRLKSAGKEVDYLEFEGLDHSLVHSGARGIMLKRIGTFLDTSLGG